MLHRKQIDPSPVQRARAQRGESQISLAQKSRRSLSTIRNAERGLATLATLQAIARVLGVTVDELTGRKAGDR